ncbi:protein P [Striga asiatica]|uniref:Protein P n=1 Tax=Striga asiatica TaxID=4170 RepID=A0A5A7QVP4_STRAF|nr:protein P [Striga asiatica]
MNRCSSSRDSAKKTAEGRSRYDNGTRLYERNMSLDDFMLSAGIIGLHLSRRETTGWGHAMSRSSLSIERWKDLPADSALGSSPTALLVQSSFTVLNNDTHEFLASFRQVSTRRKSGVGHECRACRWKRDIGARGKCVSLCGVPKSRS